MPKGLTVIYKDGTTDSFEPVLNLQLWNGFYTYKLNLDDIESFQIYELEVEDETDLCS